MQERLELLAQGIISKAEMRQWYTGETEPQAKAAIMKMQQELMDQNLQAMMQQMQVQTAGQAATDLDNEASNPVQPPEDDGDAE